MLYNKTSFKVRYGETDQMGIVNNAIYPSWFEIGRSELFDELNLPYSDMERQGIMLPLSELYVKYHSPAHYGETVTLETTIKEMPKVRVVFEYTVLSENGTLIASGRTVQAFINSITRNPMRIPAFLKDELEQYFTP